MRFFLKLMVVLAVLAGGSFFAYQKGKAWLKERNKPQFREAELERGTIRITRNATGEVKPVLSVQVGSFVSGPIVDLFVDFNDVVKKDQVLATIDPRLYEASVARDTAGLAHQKAEIKRVQAQLQRAINDEKRAYALQKENADYISQTELDQYHFAREGLEAQLIIAEASVEQASANLKNSTTNLEYTEIKSPVDGIIIDRKIDPGQTLAAQFQAPELFIIAPDMQQKMHIFASIDEADIGLIRKAKDSNQPVLFSIDAYPGEVFREGIVEQIRLSSTAVQNVVTYPVVVATPNADMRLLPGMTADLTFQVATHEDILKVPNAAIRYFPESKEYVRKEDHGKLDLSAVTNTTGDDSASDGLEDKPIDEVAASVKKAEKRHVWVLKGEKLHAVEIEIGVSDYQFTEVISGKLQKGDKVVTGLKPKV